MRSFRFAVSIWMLVAVALFSAGCGHKENEGHSHDGENAGESREEHGNEEPSAGASFKPGKGILLTDETRQILGVEVADVTQEKLPQQVRFSVQIFSEAHRFAYVGGDHAGCEFHGSGFLPPDKAALVKPKMSVQLLTNAKETVDGFVVAVQETLVYGETEVILGITKAGGKLKDGEFVTATITRPRDEEVTVIPSSALLRTVEGTFVYAVNGEAYSRMAVKVGSEADGMVEIADGLLPGGQVVTKPVQTLWLIELRATKGGGHSH